MIEIPEAHTLARQFEETLTGKFITRAVADSSHHGFAFYFGDPAEYGERLEGKRVTGAVAHGGRPEIFIEDIRLSLGEGVNPRFLAPGAPRPPKHQLLMEFDDDSAMCCTIQMYGSLQAFPDGAQDDYYYLVGKEKPSVLGDEFTKMYFSSLLTDETAKVSTKAFLATDQRIPGLGNGVCQDILWEAMLHPKRKMNTLSAEEFSALYTTVTTVLSEMTLAGGRNTEKDLFGN
ncbi:MAG: hypothetical protein FWG47_08095, partial [Propionibacteriaceae bacterium]|nr:hypothetical protein [Propionibacteriaceae bacterium]